GNVRLWDLFRQLGVPVFHLPQAWGPFENPAARSLATRVIAHATLVYARDQQSYDWLRLLPSFSAQKVHLASDIAFTFRGAGPEVGEALLRSLGLPPGEGPLVGIVPNMRVYERAEGSGLDNTYVQRLLTLTRHFTERRQCRVLLMPHEIRDGPSAREDDRVLCRLVAEAAGTPERVAAALGSYPAEELKALIGRVDLLISSRFHSIVGAMSQRRPVVALAWSHKYHELMDSVGLGDYVADHGALPEAELIALCDRAWEKRDELQASLEGRVPAHEASASAVLADVAKAVRGVL
ncbi:MAG: polysaccharide pyruvyl transferase family protein, partial [Armatimonadota bacterium]